MEAHPPARYSVEQVDYDPALGARLCVHLDGVEQRRVIAYDCEAGTVTRCVLDAEGRLVVDENREDVGVETVSGRVEVTWRAD